MMVLRSHPNGERRRPLVRVIRALTVLIGAAAICVAGSLSGSAVAPAIDRPAGATRGPVAVVQELYSIGPSGEACVVAGPSSSPIPVLSYSSCPVTGALAAALSRYAARSEADALCRCQNSFTATLTPKPSKVPSGYQGSPSDKSVRVALAFGPSSRTVIFVTVHKNPDGSWVATDTYCAARPGDRNPYANRMTSQPGPCTPRG